MPHRQPTGVPRSPRVQARSGLRGAVARSYRAGSCGMLAHLSEVRWTEARLDVLRSVTPTRRAVLGGPRRCWRRPGMHECRAGGGAARRARGGPPGRRHPERSAAHRPVRRRLAAHQALADRLGRCMTITFSISRCSNATMSPARHGHRDPGATAGRHRSRGREERPVGDPQRRTQGGHGPRRRGAPRVSWALPAARRPSAPARPDTPRPGSERERAERARAAGTRGQNGGSGVPEGLETARLSGDGRRAAGSARRRARRDLRLRRAGRPPSRRTAAERRQIWNAHRTRRDRLRSYVQSGGGPPVAAAPAYRLPSRSPRPRAAPSWPPAGGRRGRGLRRPGRGWPTRACAATPHWRCRRRRCAPSAGGARRRRPSPA